MADKYRLPQWPPPLRYFFAPFLLCLLVLLRTLVPTIYTLDSSEFVTGAKMLGFVHAPGYPLYLLLLHLFLQLPLGDMGWQGNVFSALCLTLTVPFVYQILYRLTRSAGAAMSAALIFVWSYYVWLTGLFAEVYALQLLTLAVCGWLLFPPSPDAGRGVDRKMNVGAGTIPALFRAGIAPFGRLFLPLLSAPQPDAGRGGWGVRVNGGRESSPPLLIGIAYGVAVAVHPVSLLFAPGMVAAFRLKSIPWRESLAAGLLAALIFLVSLLYFPIRAAQHPALNMAGYYDWRGQFQSQDLSTLDGIQWMLTGQQFDSLMFAEGILPSFQQIAEFSGWFIGSWLGFGFLLGLGGLYELYRKNRGLLAVWMLWFLPYAYFYLTYGAQDKDMMLGPLYLLWTLPLAQGLNKLVGQFDLRVRAALLVGLPVLMLIVNFPLLDLSQDTSVRDRSEAILEALPPDSLVFAEWRTASPLVYYQLIQKERPDIHIYNLFLFPKSELRIFVAEMTAQGKTVIFTEEAYARELLGEEYFYTPLPVNWSPPDDDPLNVVQITQKKRRVS